MNTLHEISTKTNDYTSRRKSTLVLQNHQEPKGQSVRRFCKITLSSGLSNSGGTMINGANKSTRINALYCNGSHMTNAMRKYATFCAPGLFQAKFKLWHLLLEVLGCLSWGFGFWICSDFQRVSTDLYCHWHLNCKWIILDQFTQRCFKIHARISMINKHAPKLTLSRYC